MLPGLLQYGGDMLSYHVNSVMSRPDMLQGVAEKISKYMTGAETEGEAGRRTKTTVTHITYYLVNMKTRVGNDISLQYYL